MVAATAAKIGMKCRLVQESWVDGRWALISVSIRAGAVAAIKRTIAAHQQQRSL
jgi:hypothetical protein